MPIKYVEILNQTIHRLMENDNRVFIIGQGVTSPWYVGGTCKGLLDKFGKERVIDTPVSENAVTGLAVGSAIMGMRPILVFPRMDFMLYAMDPIINQAAKWSYMFGGTMNVPLVIWAIINWKGCQGAQHSQDFEWLFRKIPGLIVVRPSGPQDVGSALKWAVENPNPVIFIDNRELYDREICADPLDTVPVQTYNDYPFCPVPASESLEKEYYAALASPVHKLF
jgi:pyruvate dehydrogenase E1 component beta subunit